MVIHNLNVLVKVSESCPLRCVYCYEGDKTDRVMDLETLEHTITKIINRVGATSTTFIWHGAEPMTAGLEFYKKARGLQSRFADKSIIKNGMQSSGVLLTPEMADFFAEEKIHVGFSLDGPKVVHDQTRRFMSGRGSFEEVMQAINLMKEKKQKPGVIAVLTRLSLPYLDVIYNFFRSEGLDFKMNTLLNCGFSRESSQIQLTPREKIEAIKYLFDRWFFDDSSKGSINYNSGMEMAKAIFTNGGSSCDMLHSCQESFVSIGVDGTIYPCSRFSGEDLTYGNIKLVTDFSDVENNPRRLKLLKRYENLEECTSCEYSQLCYSGCLHNAYIEGDIARKDPNCVLNKAVYEHISRRILEQLEKDGAIKLGGNKKCQQTLEDCVA